MTFDVGDKVVYPHHGAATIERREKKEAFGEKRDYLVLRLAYGDLTLMVPADNAEEIGLREVLLAPEAIVETAAGFVVLIAVRPASGRRSSFPIWKSPSFRRNEESNHSPARSSLAWSPPARSSAPCLRRRRWRCAHTRLQRLSQPWHCSARHVRARVRPARAAAARARGAR